MSLLPDHQVRTILKLRRPPFPSASYVRDIVKDPSMCGVCCNLYPGTAFSLIPRIDIVMHESSGTWNQWYALKAIDTTVNQKTPNRSGNRHHITEDEDVPSWAGTSRIDLASWQFTASLPDIANAAHEGCPSCQLLKYGIQGLVRGKVPFDDVDLSLVIVFCKGNVLNATVVRLEPSEESDESIPPVYGFEDSSARNILQWLDTFEFYTLPSKFTPL